MFTKASELERFVDEHPYIFIDGKCVYGRVATACRYKLRCGQPINDKFSSAM